MTESCRRLVSRHEMLVIEGAGSAAEVDLRQQDLVNWPVVKIADARVFLFSDIDRGLWFLCRFSERYRHRPSPKRALAFPVFLANQQQVATLQETRANRRCDEKENRRDKGRGPGL